MNKNNYLILMDWLKKHNINKISYNLFKQFEITKINYDKLFKKTNISINFSLHQVDNFIKNDDIILKKYKENIIFQYSYSILSSYIFTNKNTLIEAFNTVHKLILENQYELLDTFLNTLPKNKITNKEYSSIIKKVNKFINNPNYVSYIKEILNSKKNLGNLHHSNIFEMQSIITSTLKMLFIHKGNIDLKNFLVNIKKISIDEYSINLLKQKCNNSKIKFFEYMLNYYNNRFFYHGTNSKWLNNIKKYGLNGIHNFEYQKEISKAINLFETYEIYKTFEGKNNIEYINYYITDSIGSAVYYAHQAPEYLSRFCSNGDCMKLLKNCDHEAFWHRDYDTCLNNVLELCKSVKMNKNDTLFIINLFKKLWKKEVKNNQKPIIIVGQMQNIEINNHKFSEVKSKLKNYSFSQIYNILSSPSNIHNKRFATINKDFYNIIQLPNFYQLYQLKQTDFPQKKYIINNNKKYFPDIVIKNDYYKDTYFIINNSDKIKKISNTIYMIPNKFEFINNYIDSMFFRQKFEYLLLTNGISLTSKGKQYLANNSIDFQKIYEYYLKLTIHLLNTYKNTINNEDKISLYSIIANNIFYNLYIMKKTNKLPRLVDCGYKSLLHYDYDTNNYWYRSKAENNVSIDKLDSIIETIKNIVYNIEN